MLNWPSILNHFKKVKYAYLYECMTLKIPFSGFYEM